MAYLNVDEVESALAALAADHPNLCELIVLPNATHEGRTSHAVRLALGPLDDRPGVLFIGGQHAREWGSCEICINFVADVIEAYEASADLTYGGKTYSAAQIATLVEDTQVFVFPCVNPDGRNHSQTAAPMWRKNRNPGGAVDINRNYDFLWDFPTHFSPVASLVVSDNPGDDTYHGTAPESEPETRNVVSLLDDFPQIRWFIDIHSFSGLLYHNWGDDENQITEPDQNFLNVAFDGARGVAGDGYGEFIRPGDLAAETCLAARMRDALQAVRGETYQTGQSYDLYPTCGTATDYPYSRHIADPTKTKTFGFLIEWGHEFQPAWAEMENIILDVSSALVEFVVSAPCTCDTVEVTLDTPTITFNDVPEEQTTYRAAVFTVTSCRDAHFAIVAGPTVTAGPPGTAFGTPLGTSGTAPAAPGSASHGRVWISYTGTAPDDVAEGTVTIRCTETGQEFVIPITANTVARTTAVVALVLDQSNSMSFASGIGPGITRSDVLRFSAPPFVDMIEDGNALAIVRFDHDWHDDLGVTESDFAGRATANVHLAGYASNPNGWTSIGEGVARAHELLEPVADYDHKAIVVLTDGQENHDGHDRRYISDVAGLIDEHVFAIGLGTAANLQPAALEALCDGHDGYLLMTGDLDTDAYFRLAKYYQQILAGVTNQDIVTDPEGWIKPGQKHRIPFTLAETDIRSEVVVLSPAPGLFRFQVETPSGLLIDPATAGANPAVTFSVAHNVTFYRLSLPVPLPVGGQHAGTWHAVLTIDDKAYKAWLRKQESSSTGYAAAAAHGVRYCVTARAYSNLRLRARAVQASREPGATVTLRAVLTEYGVPVERRAQVRAELTRPDDTSTLIALAEGEPGVFEASFVAAMAGVYRARLLAGGKTFRGLPFTREQIVTAGIWRGGDRPPPSGGGTTGPSRDCLCGLLRCLVHVKGLREHLAKLGIDAGDVERCLAACCEGKRATGGDGAAGKATLAARLHDPATLRALQQLVAEFEREEGGGA